MDELLAADNMGEAYRRGYARGRAEQAEVIAGLIGTIEDQVSTIVEYEEDLNELEEEAESLSLTVETIGAKLTKTEDDLGQAKRTLNASFEILTSLLDLHAGVEFNSKKDSHGHSKMMYAHSKAAAFVALSMQILGLEPKWVEIPDDPADC